MKDWKLNEMTPEQRDAWAAETLRLLHRAQAGKPPRSDVEAFAAETQRKRHKCLHRSAKTLPDAGGWYCPTCGQRRVKEPTKTFPEMLHSIGAKNKEVVLLLAWNGMGAVQIAHTLNATERQVRTVLRRAGTDRRRKPRQGVSAEDLTAMQNTFWVERRALKK